MDILKLTQNTNFAPLTFPIKQKMFRRARGMRVFFFLNEK
jgi:hypothetical protein